MNFRSVPALCEWANSVFAAQFPADADRPLAAVRAARPEGGRRQREVEAPAGLFTLTHTCDDAKEVAELDAAAIARYIRSRGRCRPPQVQRLPDPHAQEEGADRPVRERARGAEHPDRGERRRRLRRVRGSRGADRAAARARRPAGQLTLVDVLRGPLFGLSDRELFAFKQAGGWFSIFCDDRQARVAREPPSRLSSAESRAAAADARRAPR